LPGFDINNVQRIGAVWSASPPNETLYFGKKVTGKGCRPPGRGRKYSPMKKIVDLLVLILMLAGCSKVSPDITKPTQVPPTATVDEMETYQYEVKRLIAEIMMQGITNPNVLNAIETVPRHRFVPEAYIEQAYANHPLPIGYGQTISQPYIVAAMTEQLALEPGDKVLEIGTGSGYQAAILAELGDMEVYSIEIVPELAQSAAARLKELGYDNVQVMEGDGYYGWLEQAPFDAIIVTAAPDHLPPPLVEQLKEDGHLVIPIGPPGFYQSLWKFVFEDGELVGYNLGGVSFVPFTGPGVEQRQSETQPTP
jgi:protein-L-isoaspartate(D-aspartate) O-methyltransferase